MFVKITEVFTRHCAGSSRNWEVLLSLMKLGQYLIEIDYMSENVRSEWILLYPSDGVLHFTFISNIQFRTLS